MTHFAYEQAADEVLLGLGRVAVELSQTLAALPARAGAGDR